MAKQLHDVLSAKSVANEKKPGRHADGGGLYLVVDPSGAKRWLLRTRVHGKRTDIGLGGLSVRTLAEARKEAQTLRRIARDGGDPLEARRRASGVPTFAEAAKTVHAMYAPSWKNAKHSQQWLNTLKQYVFPELENRRVDSIESADILRALAPIWLAKPETASRVRQRLHAVLDWAKAMGHRKGDNPVDSVGQVLPRQPEKTRHHTSVPFEQVPGFIERLRSTSAFDSTKRALEFLILTASRTNETLGARWEEIDLDAGEWAVPAERMKSKKPHRVPLPSRCVELLKECNKAASTEFIFAAPTGRPLSNMVFLQLLKRMGIEATPHGFRSSFRVWAAEQTNFPREVVELALAHVNKDKTEAAYQRSDLFLKRRALMHEWATFVTTPTATTSAKLITANFGNEYVA